MQKKDLVSLRKGEKEDLNLIYSTWLKGLYYGNDWFREIDKDIYFKYYQKVLNKILENETINITIACLKDQQDVVLGYSVSEALVLHWIFVKEPWRGIGLARDLLPSTILTVTHLTKVGRSIKPKDILFNPFLI